MANNCTSCQKKFIFMKINRTKCMECDQGFCPQCIRKGNGFRLYCNICFILNSRPVNQSVIKDIRAKDVKNYLERRDVKTDHCLEKEELVNRFLWYVDLEPRLSKNRTKKNFFNGLVNSFASSMPNLLEQNIPRGNPSAANRPNYRTQTEQASSSQRIPQGSPQYSAQQNVHPNVFPTFTNPQTHNTSHSTWSSTSEQNSSNSVPNNNATDPAQTTSKTEPTAPPRKLIRLSDIQNVEDIPNLTVKQLKELLFINRIDFKGCVEKEELVKKVVNLWIQDKAEDEPENMSGQDLCKICMDAPLNSVLLECGHIATCIECGKQLAECPICRQYIVRVVHTFKA